MEAIIYIRYIQIPISKVIFHYADWATELFFFNFSGIIYSIIFATHLFENIQANAIRFMQLADVIADVKKIKFNFARFIKLADGL